MTEALVVSNVLLWCAVVALAALVVALTRQIGLLHERIAPVGALARERGPAVGDPAPELELTDLAGHALQIGGRTSGQRTLLFFLSPECPVCKMLLPTLLRVVRDEGPGLRLVLASDGLPAEHRALSSAHGLDGGGYVLSTELGLRFAVAQLPTAVLIDEDGVVRARGIVNTREHLESLFEADERGVGSVQELARRAATLPVAEAGAAS